MIKAYKLYTGQDGHSHVKEGFLSETLLSEVLTIRFKESPPGSNYDWHCAPVTQYVICLTGTLLFTMHNTETFVLRPSEILIAMDTYGTGHTWTLVGDQPWRRAYVAFSEKAAINFMEQGTGVEGSS